LIKPEVSGLEVTPITVKSGVVHMVVVPKGSTAHQARDFVYWTRRNEHKGEMQDFEVRDVMNRQRHPKTHTQVRLRRSGDDGITLSCEVHNVSNIMALHVICFVDLPRSIESMPYNVPGATQGGAKKPANVDFTSVKDNDGREYNRVIFRMDAEGPLFAQMKRGLRWTFNLTRTTQPAHSKVVITTWADNMLPDRLETDVASLVSS
jgi:hypothetical protein